MIDYILWFLLIIETAIIIYGIWSREEFQHNAKILAEKDVAKKMYNLTKENTQLRRQVERYESVKKAEFIRVNK